MAFTVRYNALYYPIISILVILLMQESIKTKIFLILMLLTPISLFVIYTIRTYKANTGITQFSTFGGWQIASNALFMYAHIPSPGATPIPKEFKELHDITIKHIDSLKHVKQRPDNELGIYYLWDDNAPLKLYMAQKYAHDTIPYLRQWALVPPLYKKYGLWLISKYPIGYARYYLLPNLRNYCYPPTEFLAIDNIYTDTVEPAAVNWFRYKTNKVTARSKDRKIIFTELFPPILTIINLTFFLTFIFFIFSRKFRLVDPYYRKTVIIVALVWISNLIFSVFASPIVLRYQLFSLIFTFTFSGLLVMSIIENVTKRESHPL
ncbi:hypothetical protein GO495_29245 [Chitinophaga oryziterrae]|uniref:Uncharacterized protein n=1 Tax=Chitinophaga oryziterrae TaxID=1031224 RepID=A0A6N8JHD5_9BACT|nr:hypothetical protein [Chitinophaga oryziterrae]MVT44715.1 hypothetical protein [Chitinophaga oryziterrae]